MLVVDINVVISICYVLVGPLGLGFNMLVLVCMWCWYVCIVLIVVVYVDNVDCCCWLVVGCWWYGC